MGPLLKLGLSGFCLEQRRSFFLYGSLLVLLKFLEAYFEPDIPCGVPTLRAPFERRRPLLGIEPAGNVGFGQGTKLFVQRFVGNWGDLVGDVDFDSLELPKGSPRLLLLSLQQVPHNESTVQAAPRIMHGDLAEIAASALPEGGDHCGQLLGGNLWATAANEDDVL